MALREFGFTQSKADYSLFTKNILASFTALLVYVDDIILMSSNASSSTEVCDFLVTKFKIKTLGSLKYILNMEVVCSKKGIQIY